VIGGIRFAIGLATVLSAGLTGISYSAAASKISADVQAEVVKACISNPALVWADPNAAVQLCPCYVRNVVKAPDLMDAQRVYVLSFIGGRGALSSQAGALSAERQDAAFQYFLNRRMDKGCVAK
jgi:hypothetical protein